MASILAKFFGGCGRCQLASATCTPLLPLPNGATDGTTPPYSGFLHHHCHPPPPSKFISTMALPINITITIVIVSWNPTCYMLWCKLISMQLGVPKFRIYFNCCFGVNFEMSFFSHLSVFTFTMWLDQNIISHAFGDEWITNGMYLFLCTSSLYLQISKYFSFSPAEGCIHLSWLLRTPSWSKSPYTHWFSLWRTLRSVLSL